MHTAVYCAISNTSFAPREPRVIIRFRGSELGFAKPEALSRAFHHAGVVVRPMAGLRMPSDNPGAMGVFDLDVYVETHKVNGVPATLRRFLPEDILPAPGRMAPARSRQAAVH